MKSFPMFIRTTNRKVVIVGGGEQAAQKTRLMLKTDARIVLVAFDLDAELLSLVENGRATWEKTSVSVDVFQNATMAFIATGCPGLDAAAHAMAKSIGCLVNVVDQPDLCDLITPSLVDRDPVVVAIGTEGTAPVLARQIKTRVEEILAPNLGGLAEFSGRMRNLVAQRVPRAKRRAFWRWVFADAPRQAWERGAERDAAAEIKSAIAQGQAPDETGTGSIALIGAGPGAKDLLTLRAVTRLQEADVIFYDRLVDQDVLELARRDAERVFVGKVVGAHAWPQERINSVIVSAALKGQRVVRLKSGDPSIFGRAGEEIAAAERAQVPVEIVPGITSASAAAASIGRSLTERGVANTLVLATGTSQQGAADPDSVRLTSPGTTTAFYMAARQAAQIQRDLIAQGIPQHAPFTLAVDISKPSEQLINGTVGQLAQTVANAGVTGCAVILVTWPSEASALAQTRIVA
ncbi:MAG: siroheme synthase CysG [Paracoccaceae bacterium]